MRITAVFPQLQGPGGVQRFGRTMVAALTSVSAQNLRVLSLLDAPHSSAGLDVEGFAGSRFRLAREVARGCDLLICGHPNLAPLSYLSRAKAVWVHAHGIDVWRPLGRVRASALRGATLVTGSSSDTVARVRSVQGRSGTTEVLHPCVEIPATVSPKHGDYHLTVARLNVEDRDKGVDVLIEAMKRGPNLPLHVVGDGTDRARLESIAGGDPRVRFLGRINDSDLAQQFRDCRCFVLPSSKEGFGIVFAEAMAWGRPAIGVAVGGATDAIENGITGVLLPAANADAIAQAIVKIESDLAIYTKLRDGARQKSIADFSVGHFNRRVQDFLRSLGAAP